ncbi:unnamed protein product [Rotaria sordida]|uniref:Vacuolar protein sorting-associated protein 13 VPS13 adaptor binding domain-containing protein n=1 Tax=Rotaria sordida TaxID=392033 RepID=A0A815DR70_9BILA|nr:unnamed protein product [Rotaria sordida]
MVCIDIVTSSFGMTKILTLAPSTIAINKSTIEIEVAETLSQTEEEYWRSTSMLQIIPFWPRNMQDGVMRVRYTHNRISSTAFVFNQKHRTLLRMDDEERPALQVEIIATDFDGFRIVFGDYTIGDSPVLLVNCLKHLPIALSQAEDVRTQVLRPLHYVYYTWIDPLKPQALVIACLDHNASIELNDVSFHGDTAELTDHQGHRVRVKRQPLDGFWIGFAWSTSNAALHVRINRVQIDNEHEFTLFPVVLNPIVSKAAGTDIPGKPFIELSMFKTTIARSNTTHINRIPIGRLLAADVEFSRSTRCDFKIELLRTKKRSIHNSESG